MQKWIYSFINKTMITKRNFALYPSDCQYLHRDNDGHSSQSYWECEWCTRPTLLCPQGILFTDQTGCAGFWKFPLNSVRYLWRESFQIRGYPLHIPIYSIGTRSMQSLKRWSTNVSSVLECQGWFIIQVSFYGPPALQTSASVLSTQL